MNRGRCRASTARRTRRCRRGVGSAPRPTCAYCALQEREPVGLHVEELVQRVEPLLVEREIGLERLQAERDVADPRLERPDPRRVVVDLVAQRLLVLRAARSACSAARRSGSRSGASSCVVPERRRCGRKQQQECEGDSPHRESFTFGSATPAANRARSAPRPQPASAGRRARGSRRR